MARRRLDKKVLAKDTKSLASLKAIENYNPSNSRYTLEEIVAAYDRMIEKQRIEVQKRVDYDAARDGAADSEYEFHEMIGGGKTQIGAQFGTDSNEYQAIGMKKTSEYKKGGRRAKKKTD